MSVEYIKRKMPDDPDEDMACDSCRYPAAVSIFKDMDTEYGKRDVAFCEVCASTHIGTTFCYQSRHDGRYVFQSMAWIANKILDEIRKGNSSNSGE